MQENNPWDQIVGEGKCDKNFKWLHIFGLLGNIKMGTLQFYSYCLSCFQNLYVYTNLYAFSSYLFRLSRHHQVGVISKDIS